MVQMIAEGLEILPLGSLRCKSLIQIQDISTEAVLLPAAHWVI